MKDPNKRWIVYDANCGLCLFSKKWMSRLGFFNESDCLNYYELSPEMSQKVELERFKHGMAHAPEGAGDTLYGLEGVLSAFSEKRPYLKKWHRNTLIFRVLDFFYHAICHNRYFIFPIKRRFTCDCEPPFNPRFYRRWIYLGVFFSTLISFLFGMALGKLFDMAPLVSGLRAVMVVGAGWTVQLAVALLLMNKLQFRDYIRHITLIMSAGVLVLIPCLLFFWLPVSYLLPLTLLSVGASSLLMLSMHIKRIRFMELGQQWTFSWFLSLQTVAFTLMLHYQFIQL